MLTTTDKELLNPSPYNFFLLLAYVNNLRRILGMKPAQVKVMGTFFQHEEMHASFYGVQGSIFNLKTPYLYIHTCIHSFIYHIFMK